MTSYELPLTANPNQTVSIAGAYGDGGSPGPRLDLRSLVARSPAPVPTARQRELAASIVAKASKACLPLEPLLDPTASHVQSTLLSVVRRHGLVIQRTIGESLEQSSRFRVCFDHKLTIREPDASPLNSQFDVVSVDLVALDLIDASVGLYEVKRGNGVTESRRRNAIVHALQRAHHIPLDYFSCIFGTTVRALKIGVVDYYGRSGFTPPVALHGARLNEHFGIDLITRVEQMTEALRNALAEALSAACHNQRHDLIARSAIVLRFPDNGLSKDSACWSGSGSLPQATDHHHQQILREALLGDPGAAIGLAIERLVLHEDDDPFRVAMLMTLLSLRAAEGHSTACFVLRWMETWLAGRAAERLTSGDP